MPLLLKSAVNLILFEAKPDAVKTPVPEIIMSAPGVTKITIVPGFIVNIKLIGVYVSIYINSTTQVMSLARGPL